MSRSINTCKCGCGIEVKKLWATGHHRKGATFKMSKDAKEKISQAQLAHNSMAGKTPWNKGQEMGEETKQKVKKARAKQVITTEHRIAISEGLKKAYKEGVRTDIGEKKKFWQGGTLADTRRARNSFEIRLWREAVFKRDNWTCQDCGVRGGNLNAHHKKSFAWFPELRTAIDNGVTLCRQCHLKYGTYKGRNPKLQIVGSQS